MKKSGIILTIIVATAIVLLALYIMANRLGLVPGLDFGAGAYYYADIPEWEKYDRVDFSTPWLTFSCIVLFLAWGFLMFKLWQWVDRHSSPRK